MTRPDFRAVDALTGAKAPAVFFQALSEADEFCSESNRTAELEVRVMELEQENRELRELLSAASLRGESRTLDEGAL